MLNLFKRFHFGQVKFSTQKNPLFTLWVDIAYKRLAKLEAVNVLVKEALLDYKGVDKAQLPTVEILRTFEDYSSDRSRNVMLNAAKHLLKCLEIDQAGAEQFQSSRRLFWNEFIQAMEATEIGQVIATHHNDLELEGLLPAAFKNEDAVALSYAEDLSEGISRKRNRGGDSLAALRSIETQAGNVPEAKGKRLRTG